LNESFVHRHATSSLFLAPQFACIKDPFFVGCMYQRTTRSELYRLLSRIERVPNHVFLGTASVPGGDESLSHLKLAAEQIKSYIDEADSNPWNIRITDVSEFRYDPVNINRNVNYHASKYASGNVTIILCDYGITPVWGIRHAIAIEIQYNGGICAEGALFSYDNTWDPRVVKQKIKTMFERAYTKAEADSRKAEAKLAADEEKKRELVQKMDAENARRLLISQTMDPIVSELSVSLRHRIAEIPSLNDKRREAFVYATTQLALLS
jgi:hypothetical protein